MGVVTSPAGTAARHYAAVGASLPIPAEVDWSQAPVAHKLYRGLPRTPLGDDDPLGRLCADTYRVSRQRWTSPSALRRVIGSRGAVVPDGRAAVSTLRPVPSGGARFPVELYLVTGPGAAAPVGVHYYDPAHHTLVTLRAGDHRGTVAAALGSDACRWPAVTVLVSLRFAKNAFKYGELCYRLGNLDAGVVVGQVLAAAPGTARVRLEFVDDELDDLLGLDPVRESVHAVLSIGPDEPVAGPAPATPVPPSGDAGTWALTELPAPAAVHRASRYPSVQAFRGTGVPAACAGATGGGPVVELPDTPVDLRAAVPARRSSMGYFVRRTLPLPDLAALLRSAVAGDPGAEAEPVRTTELYCVVNDVRDVPAGVYRYDPDRHAAVRVRSGDLGHELQRTLTVNLFNLCHTGVCLYPVGRYEDGLAVYGDRWYRMQNLQAGMIAQRVYLAAAARGLRCHANLGYRVAPTDELLALGPGRTSLLQVMVGAGREPGDYYELVC